KAERSAKLLDEKFAVQVTLARRHLDRLAERTDGLEARFKQLSELLPAEREGVGRAADRREEAARARTAAEAHRTEIARRLGSVRVEVEKLDGDLALAAERLGTATSRRTKALEERTQTELRAALALTERDAAAAERAAAEAEHANINVEVASRAGDEES